MKRKILSLVLAMLAMAVLLASCQGGADISNGNSGTDSGTSAEPTKAAPQNITMSHVQGEWMWPMLKNVTDEYTRLSGNTVELLYVPADTYATWITTQFAGNTEPDIVSGAGQLLRNSTRTAGSWT
jgi:ABC-type glycerol-3-phosphate transport system substrate-binding protein